jgi:hypothetical protein
MEAGGPLDLHEIGVELMRQNLHRAHPDAADEEIDLLFASSGIGSPLHQ